MQNEFLSLSETGWSDYKPQMARGKAKIFVSKGVRFCCESVGNYVSILCSTEDWQCTVQGGHKKISAFQ